MTGRAAAVERPTTAEAWARAELHAGAWLAWIAAVSALAFLTSNPLYVGLAFIAAFAVYLSVADTPRGRAMIPVVVFGLALALISIPFNLLTGSNGDSVVLELPSVAFPDWFGGVTLGGDVTGEALTTAGGRALGIATLVVAAAAFNSGVDHFRLLKLAPPALAQVMIVFTVAALVAPQGVARAKAVMEGRRLRGRRTRGVRAIGGLVMPVLQGALEGAVQRAESLDSRGFGGRVSAPAAWKSLAAVVGLGVFAWGTFSYYYQDGEPLYFLAMAAGALITAASLYAGSRRQRAGGRAGSLGLRDWLLLSAAAASTLLVLGLRLADAGDVTYLPYPDFDAPAFHAAGAVAAVLLLAPALLMGQRHD